MALLVAGLCAGCIMPIPHRRVHSFGVEGRVLDASTLTPVTGAVVSSPDHKRRETTTNDKGQFSLRPAYGWHGAYLIGPISESLLPGWDITFPGTAVDVAADGYQNEHFWIVDEDAPREGPYLKAGDLRLSPLTTGTKDLSIRPRPVP